jgi:hypothetical protein
MKQTTPIREAWAIAWRTARIIHKSKPQNHSALCNFTGVQWLALCRISSRDMPDPICATPEQNMIATRIVNEILEEG